MNMKDLIAKLVEDFNIYSEMVALNRQQVRENSCYTEILQWNRGHKQYIEDFLNEIAENFDGVYLIWECEKHIFDTGSHQRQLTYRTVKAVYADDIKKKQADRNKLTD